MVNVKKPNEKPQIKKEKKSIKSGIRFKPSVYKMLDEISNGNKAGKIEELIIKEFKNIGGMI